MRVVIVPEFDDERVPFQLSLNDAALDAAPAPVDDADFAQAGGGGGVDVFVDHGGDVSGWEGMEVERVLDRNTDGLVSHQPLAISPFSSTPP